MNIPQILWYSDKYKDCVWKHSGDASDISTLDWADSNTIEKPTLQQLQIEWDSNVSAIVELKNVQQQRATAYPSIAEQLDLLYHDIKNGALDSGNWIAAIEAVKTQYPKP